MSSLRTVLAQILAGLSGEEFSRCAARHPMQRTPSAISAYDHFATLVFAQLAYRESLRDIEACLQARRSLLYHSGIRGSVKRCNLAYAMRSRGSNITEGIWGSNGRRYTWSRSYGARASAFG